MSKLSGINEEVPSEVINFSFKPLTFPEQPKSLATLEELLTTEIRDAKRQIAMREPVAIFFGLLLVAQNIGLFFIVVWALNKGRLGELQLIFSILVTGTLAQTYFISQLIVERLFKPISYKDKHRRFDKYEREHGNEQKTIQKTD